MRRKKGRKQPPNVDILQNLEFMIVKVYKQNPELTDFEVKKAIEALERYYKAIDRGRRPPTIRLRGRSQDVCEFVQTMCEWRLGQRVDDDWPAIEQPTSPDVIVKCLRRIKKSIDFWTQEAGIQGYLNYIINFIK
ncbi:MAG: hypothetical protein ACPGWR_32590 [Ardenticatenaceae bacterium]